MTPDPQNQRASTGSRTAENSLTENTMTENTSTPSRTDPARPAAWPQPQLDGAKVLAESITLVVCLPLAPVLMILVAREGWRPWWLMVAGALAAWAGDALWNLSEHIVNGHVARARARRVASDLTSPRHESAPVSNLGALEHRHRLWHEHIPDDIPPPRSGR